MNGATVVRRLASAVAVVFGLATLAAGGRVLLGADPGYVVFRPLLVYNTTMGLAYLAAGWLLLRGSSWARAGAGTILLMNAVVLGTIVTVYRAGGGVAVDSLRAMSLRTVVWLALFLASVWVWPRLGRNSGATWNASRPDRAVSSRRG